MNSASVNRFLEPPVDPALSNGFALRYLPILKTFACILELALQAHLDMIKRSVPHGGAKKGCSLFGESEGIGLAFCFGGLA
jgi:hypothetical protein